MVFLYLMLGALLTSAVSNDDNKSAALPRNAIVFAHHADAARKDYDIWQIAADGTQMASVLVLPGRQAQFTISPNGDELIYVDSIDGQQDLWRRKFSGGAPVNLTTAASKDSSPQWSPDGTKLLFSSDRDAEKPELYVMTLESKEVQRLTDNSFHDSDMCWAPDGASILFTRFLPGDEATKTAGKGVILRYELTTGKEVQLTDLSGYCGGVAASPDGRTIAFHRSSEEGSELWIMNADGTDQKPLTDSYVDEYSPAWSPDGQWIAYTAGTGHDGLGTFDLWLMRPDGSDRRLVTAAANTQMSPAWRPGDHFVK